MMQVSTNGVISFQSGFTDFVVSSFPTSSVPLIAPLWADFDFRDREGNVFYRVAEDEATLKRAREMLLDANQDISEFIPTFCVIVTWSEATLFNSFSITSSGSGNGNSGTVSIENYLHV